MSEDTALVDEEDQVDPSTAEESASAPDAGETLMLSLWVSEAAKQRFLDAHRFRITEDRSLAGDAGIVVVSTRLPPGTPISIVKDLRSATTAPIVVLCHPGAEEKALHMMKAGANAVVAEGKERAALRLLMDLPGDESLVDNYAGAVDRQWLMGGTNLRRDSLTNLLTTSSFELRLADLEQAGEIPRLTMVRLVDLESVQRATGPTGFDVMRRRLAYALANASGLYGGEIYGLDPSLYAVVGRNQTAEDSALMARAMVGIASSFVPGGTSLRVAVGQAGPEVSTDVGTLRGLASKALEAAVGREGSAIVDAEELTQVLAGQTELDAALHVIAHVDGLAGGAGSHSQRVADYATELALELSKEFELDSRARDRITLAAKIHSIGRIAANGDEADPSTEEEQAHVERGYEYAVVAAGSEVALAVRHHHEHWDGSGYPDHLAEEAIPIGARIVAVADALDLWMSPREGDALSPAEAATRLGEVAGSEFDPSVVKAAVRLLKQ